MELMDAVRGRRSVRCYLEQSVEEEKLEAVLEAGRLAPSARNMQDWKFIVVRDFRPRAAGSLKRPETSNSWAKRRWSSPPAAPPTWS